MSKQSYSLGAFKPYIMWCIPVLFFAHQFILRLWPGLMMEQILQQFAIDATLFGTLAASYYYGYAGMQVPVALLLERYGPRKIVSLFAIICGIAMVSFTCTTNFYIALISRFLIGAASAAGFLGFSKVISEWFDKKAYSKMVGFSFTLGLTGAVYGGKPLGLLVETYPWKSVALALGVISIAIGVIAYAFLRSPPKPQISDHNAQSLSFSDLRAILSSRVIWIVGIANLLMVGVLEGFADAWGVQYLMTLYPIVKSDAAGLISCIFIGMLIGGPLLAFLSEKTGKYTILALSGIGMAFIFTLFLSNMINQSLAPYLLFASGIMCCYQVIIFALGSELVSQKHMGVCIAFLNCINMLGGSFFHGLIGFSMDAFGSGSLSMQGLPLYDIHAYQYALSIIPICALLGGVSFVALGLQKSEPKPMTS